MKLAFYVILFFATIICDNNCSENNATIDDKLQVEILKGVSPIINQTNSENGKQVALDFVERLKTGEHLASLFSSKWTFVYHEDNRCSGSTDGKVTYDSNITIDKVLSLKVKNDSEYAWACEKKEPYHYEMTFSLKEKLEIWDRIELQSEEYSDGPDKQENTFFILGGGASDYIKIQVNEHNLISTFTYSSEDPG